MCLAIPGKLLERDDGAFPFCVGKVEFGGLIKEINLSFVPEAKPGDYVITHVGVAIQVIDETEAKRSLRLLDEAFEQ